MELLPTSNGLEQEGGSRGVVDSRKIFVIKQEVGHFRQNMDSEVQCKYQFVYLEVNKANLMRLHCSFLFTF